MPLLNLKFFIELAAVSEELQIRGTKLMICLGATLRANTMSNPLAVPRTSIFKKYFYALFAATVVPLLIAGGSEAWFGYHDQRARLNDLLNAEARYAAVKIHDFIEGIQDQLGWTVLLPWTEDSGDRHRLDALRLLRQVPAIESLTLVDAGGRERLFVSRIGLNRIQSGDDHSANPAVRGALANRAWFGPVTYHGGSEPFMAIAVAGNRAANGAAIAEVNLKFIWDVISGIRIGRTGDAFVLDRRAASWRIRTSAWCCERMRPCNARSRVCGQPFLRDRARRRWVKTFEETT